MMIPTGRAGESIPQLVMRTGIVRSVRPENARRDISIRHVEAATRLAVGQPMSPGFFPPTPAPLSPAAVTPMIPAPASPTTSAVAACVTATPPMPLPVAPVPMPHSPSGQHHWHRAHRVHPLAAEINRLHPHAHMHGADDVLLGEWAGRPLAKFQVASSLSQPAAQSAVNALHQAAAILRRTGLTAALTPELAGGPLIALMRGGAVELHFQNGVVARTAL